MLANVPSIEFSDASTKTKLLGQAHFLRGLYYYDLALLWGSSNASLPIVLDPSKPGDKPQGYNETDVYNQSISDLQKL